MSAAVETPFASIATADDAAECYICYAPADASNPLLTPSPCTCKGSIGIHTYCFVQMQLEKPSHECCVCHTPFTYTPSAYTFFDETATDGLRTTGYRHIINGQYDNVLVTYWPSGNHKEIIEYANGLRHGRAMSYYEDGSDHVKCSYKSGQLDGEYQEFYDNGKLHIKGNYTNDGFVEQTIYYTNGQVASSYDFVSIDGQMCPHGYYNTFHENGRIKTSGQYDYGKKIGTEFIRYPSGNLRANIEHVDGKMENVMLFFDTNDIAIYKQAHITYHKNAILPDFELYYHENGAVKAVFTDCKKASPSQTYLYTMGSRRQIDDAADSTELRTSALTDITGPAAGPFPQMIPPSL
jgi:antitoxin component YwqK of YwqJK toxin-antitoxin module